MEIDRDKTFVQGRVEMRMCELLDANSSAQWRYIKLIQLGVTR